MRKIFCFFAAMLLCLPMMQGAIKVHTIGDSTMAEYDESTTDKRGWGMYLGWDGKIYNAQGQILGDE